jgi:predicted NBD/HSP70 family sugar kinase
LTWEKLCDKLVGMSSGIAGNVRDLRRNNRGLVLQILREHGPMHRAELARRSGLSRSAMSGIVLDLLNENVLMPVVPRTGTAVGRGGELLTFASGNGLLAGIDYSLGAVCVVVTDLSHAVVGEQIRQLEAGAEWPERLDQGIFALGEVLAGCAPHGGTLRGVGLGIPDPVDLQSGTIGHARSGPTWTGARARQVLSEQVGVPVVLDNTSHLAALAEVIWGSAAGVQNMIYVKMSHGVGAGFLINGEIYRGSIGAAGELGHVSIDDNGPACPCGNRGCLELYVGGTALLELLKPGWSSQVSLGDLIGAAIDGHRVARRLISDAGATTGRVLASVCNLLDPDLIVIGGDLPDAGDLLLDPLRASLTKHAVGIIGSHVKVVPAALGHRGGALGGIALLRQHLQGPDIGHRKDACR